MRSFCSAIRTSSQDTTYGVGPAIIVFLLIGGFCLNSVGAEEDIRQTATVKVLAKAKPCVAVVYAFDSKGKPTGTGSGSVIDPRGYVLTAKHVVKDHHVVVLQGRPPLVAALVGSMPEHDIALLKLGPPAFSRPGSPDYPRAALPLDYLTIAAGKDLMLGETILNVGSPGGRGIVATEGIVSSEAFTGVNPLSTALESSQSFDEMIQFDAANNRGNSGGPLINLNGEQVGVVVSGIPSEEGIHFAVPAETIRLCVQEILCGELRSGFVSGITVNQQLSNVIVTNVDAKSPASEAGLEVGDKIVKVSGRPIRDPIDWSISLAHWRAGQTQHLVIHRGKEILQLPLELRKRLGEPASELVPNDEDIQNGLQCRYAAYDPNQQTPLDDDTVPEGQPIIVSAISAKPQDVEMEDHYEMVLSGYLNVPEDGRYRLGIRSDDGSKLFLHGKLVADNNGNHAAILRTGWVSLQAGLHPIEIEYYEDEGNQVLELLIGHGDEELEPVVADQLFYQSTEMTKQPAQ
ncbi:trypsin-like peptidase domain-containing protein [Stieleria sp. JC731]|uniref:trypsin-like peptidase domain-containing protein n=1 Tax=Pirellulaceae TaxID=2691357 RepID=UPI001E34CF9F|nr:trypsin-like peptidase domain-containing protein [Stieleria sp. JC731]MCC9601762.1 trypsin-like peptidase domain-containing protein [Stieleria sp. JC731]